MLYEKTLGSYLQGIKENIDKLERRKKKFTSFEKFRTDEDQIDLASMPLFQIAEICNNMYKLYPDSLELPRKNIIGFRNIIAHHYHKLDVERLWFTIEYSIPELKRIVEEYTLDQK